MGVCDNVLLSKCLCFVTSFFFFFSLQKVKESIFEGGLCAREIVLNGEGN